MGQALCHVSAVRVSERITPIHLLRSFAKGVGEGKQQWP